MAAGALLLLAQAGETLGQAASAGDPGRSARVFKDMYYEIGFDDGKVFEYSPADPEVAQIAAGDVLWHGTYDTQISLRRVKSVTRTAHGTIAILTEPMTVADVAPSIRFQLDPSRDDAPFEMIEYPDGKVEKYTSDERLLRLGRDPELRPMTAKPASISPMGQVGISGSLEIPLYTRPDADHPGPLVIYNGETTSDWWDPVNYGANLKVTAQSIKITYTPAIDVGFTTDLGKLTEAHAKFTDSINVKEDIRYDIYVGGDYAYRKLLYKWSKLFTPWIGAVPVPILVDVKVYAVFEAVAAASGYFQAGLDLTSTGSDEVRWNKTDGWSWSSPLPTLSLKPYNSDPKSVNGAPTWGYDGHATAELRIEPYIGAYFAGLFGPRFVPSPSLRFSGRITGASDASTDYSWGLYGCFNAKAEFVLDALGAGDCSDVNGLKVEFFDGKELEKTSLSGSAWSCGTPNDNEINVNWGTGGPTGPTDMRCGASGTLSDNFSVRWSGTVEPRYSETYTLCTNTNQGARLWIDDALVVDNWSVVADAETEKCGTVDMKSGQRYKLKMEYWEGTGNASAHLYWQSASQGREIIPQGRLFPCSPYFSKTIYDKCSLITFDAKNPKPIDPPTSPGGNDIGPSTICVPFLTSPVAGTITNDLTPTFTWTCSGATTTPEKYEVKIGEAEPLEAASSPFTPAADLRPGVLVPVRVRAFAKNRWGMYSNEVKINIGVMVSSGSSYYGKLDVGNFVSVTDPRMGGSRVFYLWDIDSKVSPRKVLLKHTGAGCPPSSGQPSGNWCDLFVDDKVARGGAQIGDDFGLFVYPATIFDSTAGRFSELLIAPYFLPQLVILQPQGGALSGAEVRVAANYLGKDVPWRDIGNPPQWTTSLKTLCYNGACGSAESFVWTLSPTTGDQTMTVTLTDLLGQKITRSVTAQYDSSSPFYVYRGPLGDDYRCIDRSFRTLSDGWTIVSQYVRFDNAWGPCRDYIGGESQDKTREGLIDIMVNTLGLAQAASSVPAGTTGVFVVDRSQYDDPNPINATYGAITYRQLYQALAWALGKDSRGYYRVWVSSSAGTRSVYDAIPCIDLPVPAPPTFSGVTPSSVTVNWANLSGEAGYQVQRCTGAGCTGWANVGPQLAADVTSYTDTSVAGGATYSYRIVAKGVSPCADQTSGPAVQTTTSPDGITNGNFEGAGGWTGVAPTGWPYTCPATVSIGTTDGPYEGSRCGKIYIGSCWASNSALGYIRQTITVPANACTLNYAIMGQGSHSNCGNPQIAAKINSTVLESWSPFVMVTYDTCGERPVPWTQRSYDISAYRGQTITLEFSSYVDNNASGMSSAGIDAVWISVPPGAPVAPSFSGITNNRAFASWPAVPNAVGYRLVVTGWGTVTTSGTGAIIDSLAPSTKYTATLTAFDDCGTSPTGPMGSFTTLCANPGAPGQPTFSGVSANGVTVSWGDVANEVGYQVQRARYTAGACEAFVDVGTALGANVTSYADLGSLSPSTTYCYKVVANAASGCTDQPGTFSTVTTACVNPGGPGAPTFSGITSSSIIVSWADVANDAGYQVQRCTGPGCASFANLGAQLAAGTTTFTDSGLPSSTTYRYRVIAIARSGCTNQTGTSSADVKTLCMNPGVPGAPTFSNILTTSLTVSWADVANEAGYQVQRCTGSSCTSFANVGTQLLAGTVSWSDSSLAAGMTFRYRVIAIAASGCASQTGVASANVTTLACTSPGAPGAPVFSNVRATSLTVGWTDVAGEAGYQVQRCQGPGCASFANVGTQLAAGIVSFDDAGLSPGVYYSYRIIAVAAPGCSSQTGTSASVTTFALADSFADLNYTSNPAWTNVTDWGAGGTLDASSGALRIYQTSDAGNSARTPSTTAYGTWQLRFKLGSVGGCDNTRVVWYLLESGSSHYYVKVQQTENTIKLGNQAGVLGTAAFTPSSGVWYTLKVTRDASGQFQVLLDGALKLTVTDNALTGSSTTRIAAHRNCGWADVYVDDVVVLR